MPGRHPGPRPAAISYLGWPDLGGSLGGMTVTGDRAEQALFNSGYRLKMLGSPQR